jgi:hypothetical protein
MKDLLNRLPQKRTVAILVGEHEIVVSRVSQSLGEFSIQERHSIPYPTDRLVDHLAKIFEPWKKHSVWRKAPIVVGLSTLGTFFSTRPLRVQSCDATPQVLLHEMLRSSTLNIDDMEVDMIKHLVGKQPVASVLACQKKVVSPLLRVIRELGLSPQFAEPAPCALLRDGVRQHKSPKRAKSVLRIFLGDTTALAILTALDVPLLWRPATLAPGGEATSVFSLYRCMEKLARHTGLDAPPEDVIIHGRPDLTAVSNPDLWDGKLNVTRVDGPTNDADSIARGLAIGAYSQVEGFNVARSLRPRLPLRKKVPWLQVTLQGGLIAAGGVFLSSGVEELERTTSVLQVQRSQLSWLKDQNMASLQAEKKKLTDRLEVVRGFMGGRLAWSASVREVAEELPPEMTLASIEGRCEYKPDPQGRDNQRQSKRQLIAAIEAPLSKGEAIPREIDGLLFQLRKNQRIREDLPTVELGTLRWGLSGKTRQETAAFTILCLPKAQAKSNKSGGPG